MSEIDILDFLDDQSKTTSDGGSGFEVFKNAGNASEIKSVRVPIQTEARRANEQAPTKNNPKSTEIPNSSKSVSADSDLGRQRPSKLPVTEISSERPKSANKNQHKETQSKPAQQKSEGPEGIEKKRKILGVGGNLSNRQTKLLAESNLNDAQASAAATPSNSSQCNFLLATMVTGISYYYIFSFLGILTWTCVCTYYMESYRKFADDEGNDYLKRWINWFDETDVRMIGSLFVFSLVFRFNQCYNRWWQGRMLWGQIIQNCLDFSRKVTLWVRNKEYSDRLNRYIVAFPYAAKAQLRGLSLTDETESGQSLVDRGFLTPEELDFLRENPCWEPEFFLDLMRAVVAKVILAQWEREPDEQVLILPHSNRVHDRLFPPMEKAIIDLGNNIGEGVSVRSAGLPRSYDTVHYIFFWIYFLLAPMAEAATIGWLAPVVLGFSSCIIMTLMDMGTAMVDPFGTDLVDLPIERFCETIEAQVLTIQRRHKTGHVLDFASFSTPGREFHADEYQKGRAHSTIQGLIH